MNPIAYGVKLADALSFGLASDALDRLPRGLSAALTDPVFGSIARANIATLGWAATDLNLSQTGVMKLFLYYHYIVIYTLVANSVSRHHCATFQNAFREFHGVAHPRDDFSLMWLP